MDHSRFRFFVFPTATDLVSLCVHLSQDQGVFCPTHLFVQIPAFVACTPPQLKKETAPRRSSPRVPDRAQVNFRRSSQLRSSDSLHVISGAVPLRSFHLLYCLFCDLVFASNPSACMCAAGCRVRASSGLSNCGRRRNLRPPVRAAAGPGGDRPETPCTVRHPSRDDCRRSCTALFIAAAPALCLTRKCVGFHRAVSRRTLRAVYNCLFSVHCDTSW